MPSATSAPRIQRRALHGRTSTTWTGGAGLGAIVARTTSFCIDEGALALFERRRDVGELDEVAVLQERGNLGERHPELGHLAKRR